MVAYGFGSIVCFELTPKSTTSPVLVFPFAFCFVRVELLVKSLSFIVKVYCYEFFLLVIEENRGMQPDLL